MNKTVSIKSKLYTCPNVTNLGEKVHLDYIDKVIHELRMNESIARILRSFPIVTIFGSARFKENNHSYEMTRNVAGQLAEKGFMIMTGGGPGIMEAANRGAFEKYGVSIGHGIKLPFEQGMNKYISVQSMNEFFFTRKLALTLNSSAFIISPGGYGTMDELFDILALKDRVPTMRVPVILYGKDFYQGLYKLLEKSSSYGLLRRPLSEMLVLLDKPEEVTEYIITNKDNENADKTIDIRKTRQILTDAFLDLDVKGFRYCTSIIGSSINKLTASCKNNFKAGTIAEQLSALGYSILFRGNQQISNAIIDGYNINSYEDPESTAQIVCLDCYQDNLIQSHNRLLQTSNKVVTSRLFEQKVTMSMFTNLGYAFFPGGTSVMDIFFENLCLKQTGKINHIPIAAINSDFWEPWKDYFSEVFVKEKTINREDLDIFRIFDNPDDVVPYFQEFKRKTNN